MWDLPNDEADNRRFEFVNQVRFEQILLDLIDGFRGFISQSFEPVPDEKSTSDVVALDAVQAALAASNAAGLFDLAVQLLDFPADGARPAHIVRGAASFIVGGDKIDPAGRGRDTEPSNFVIFGAVFDFDGFTLLLFAF